MSYRLLIIFLASSAEMGENRLKVLPSLSITSGAVKYCLGPVTCKIF